MDKLSQFSVLPRIYVRILAGIYAIYESRPDLRNNTILLLLGFWPVRTAR